MAEWLPGGKMLLERIGIEDRAEFMKSIQGRELPIAQLEFICRQIRTKILRGYRA